MHRYVLARIAGSVLTLVLVTAGAFTLAQLLPGDPVRALAGADEGQLSEAEVEEARDRLGLNRPVPLQYLAWLGRIVQGDWGESVVSHESVADMIRQRGGASLQVIVFAMFFALAIGVPAAVIAALRKGRVGDLLASGLAGLGLAIPHFLLGIVLIIVFGVELSWLPSSGYVSVMSDPLDGIKHTILPAFAIGFSAAAIIARQLRASILEVLQQDFVRTAHAKGLGIGSVMTGHVLRNALLPVITVTGLLFSRIFSNAIIVENVFAIPGLGRLSLSATLSRDYPVIMGVVLVSAIVVVLVNLMTDLCYSVLDPRIRLG